MKNTLALLLACVLCLSMAACGSSNTASSEATAAPAAETAALAENAAPSETEAPAATEAAAETATISDENKALIEDTLQAIYDVQPGSAGSSLRATAAAGKLLDLAESLTDQADASELAQICYDWSQKNDKIEGAFDEAYVTVREIAFNYLSDPDAYAGQFADCGYQFTHGTHTQSYLEYVTNYIEISRATGE